MNRSTADTRHLILLTGIAVVLFILLSALRPGIFLTVTNLQSMAIQVSFLGLLSLAVATTLLVGAIDLSVLAIANLSAILAAFTITAVEPAAGAAVGVSAGLGAGLLTGGVAGTLNGLLVSRLRVHPIVITLGTMILYTGIATGLTGGRTVYSTGSLEPIGTAALLGIPVPFLITAVAIVILHIATTRTPFGLRVRTIGKSEPVSRYARLNVVGIQTIVYIVSGCLSAIGGLMILAQNNATNVEFGSSFLVQAILVAILAGVNPYGGSGRLVYILVALAVLQQVSTGLNMLFAGWQGATFAREFVWGLLLIAVLAGSRIERRRVARPDPPATSTMTTPTSVVPTPRRAFTLFSGSSRTTH